MNCFNKHFLWPNTLAAMTFALFLMANFDVYLTSETEPTKRFLCPDSSQSYLRAGHNVTHGATRSGAAMNQRFNTPWCVCNLGLCCDGPDHACQHGHAKETNATAWKFLASCGNCRCLESQSNHGVSLTVDGGQEALCVNPCVISGELVHVPDVVRTENCSDSSRKYESLCPVYLPQGCGGQSISLATRGEITHNLQVAQAATHPSNTVHSSNVWIAIVGDSHARNVFLDMMKVLCSNPASIPFNRTTYHMDHAVVLGLGSKNPDDCKSVILDTDIQSFLDREFARRPGGAVIVTWQWCKYAEDARSIISGYHNAKRVPQGVVVNLGLHAMVKGFHMETLVLAVKQLAEECKSLLEAKGVLCIFHNTAMTNYTVADAQEYQHERLTPQIQAYNKLALEAWHSTDVRLGFVDTFGMSKQPFIFETIASDKIHYAKKRYFYTAVVNADFHLLRRQGLCRSNRT